MHIERHVVDVTTDGAAAGTAVLDRIPVAGRIKIAIASGGAAKLGKFHVLIG